MNSTGEQKLLSQGNQAGSIPVILTITPNSTGVQRAVFQAVTGGFNSRRRDQFSGPKLTWRSTRLLIERTEFDSLWTHQVVPV